MKKIKEFFADMTETVSVTKLDGTLIVAIAALSGVIIRIKIVIKTRYCHKKKTCKRCFKA